MNKLAHTHTLYISIFQQIIFVIYVIFERDCETRLKLNKAYLNNLLVIQKLPKNYSKYTFKLLTFLSLNLLIEGNPSPDEKESL